MAGLSTEHTTAFKGFKYLSSWLWYIQQHEHYTRYERIIEANNHVNVRDVKHDIDVTIINRWSMSDIICMFSNQKHCTKVLCTKILTCLLNQNVHDHTILAIFCIQLLINFLNFQFRVRGLVNNNIIHIIIKNIYLFFKYVLTMGIYINLSLKCMWCGLF